VEPIIYNEEEAKNFAKETREKNKGWLIGKAENAVGYEYNHERKLTVGGKPFGNYSVTELLG